MEKSIKTKPEPYCPECGAMMVLRRPRKHQEWSPFWGCGRWPNCDRTRKIDFTTGEYELTEQEYMESNSTPMFDMDALRQG